MTPRICVIVCLLLLSSLGYSQVTHTIVVKNHPSPIITISPIDADHIDTVPESLKPFVKQLPLGSFLLKNSSDSAITAVDTQFSFTSRTGVVTVKRIRCDGYISPPLRIQVRPHDVTLITPGSCTKGELFSNLGGPSFGSPLSSTSNANLLNVQAEIGRVEITVDSVIFQDGGIWGPDTQEYYRRIWERHLAAQSFVKEVDEASAHGEDVQRCAKRIKENSLAKMDRSSALKAHYAAMLIDSINPEQTLAVLRSREPLPDFHHMEERQ